MFRNLLFQSLFRFLRNQSPLKKKPSTLASVSSFVKPVPEAILSTISAAVGRSEFLLNQNPKINLFLVYNSILLISIIVFSFYCVIVKFNNFVSKYFDIKHLYCSFSCICSQLISCFIRNN